MASRSVHKDMSDQTTKAEAPKVTISYLKGNSFRVIKVDGAIGGLNPRGEITMSVYNERVSLPNQQVFEVTSGGGLKLVSEAKDNVGLIREMEAVISLRPEVALGIAKWLLKKVEAFEQKTGLKFIEDEEGNVDVENEPEVDLEHVS